MLEKCSSLRDCENALQYRLSGVRILGEVVPEPGDIEIVSALIKREMGTGRPSRVIESLSEQLPWTFSWYLTWVGMMKYTEGRFWPEILESVGLSGVRWERQIGEAFLKALKTIGLDSADVPGTNRYVTAILLQGGIPDSCVSGYYQHVVRYFVEDNLLSRDAIAIELDLLREEEVKLRRGQEELGEKRELENRVAVRAEELKRYVELRAELASRESAVPVLSEEEGFLIERGDGLLLNWDATRQHFSREIATGLAAAEKMLDKRQTLLGVMKRFTPQDERALTLSEVVDRLSELLVEEQRVSRKCEMLQQQASMSLKRASDVLSPLSERLGVRAADMVKALWACGSSDAALSALREVLAAKDSVEAELREKGWLEQDGNVRDIHPPSGRRWLGVAGWGICALVSLFGLLASWQRGLISAQPFIIATILSTVAAALRAYSIVLTSKSWRRLLGLWDAQKNQVAQVLSRIGIASDRATFLASEDCEILGAALDERRVYQSLSSELDIELGRLQQLREEIDRLRTIVDSCLSDGTFEELGTVAPGGAVGSPALGGTVICPAFRIKLARRRKEEAERAKIELEEQIEPALTRSLRYIFHTQLLRYLGDTKVKLVGCGDMVRGAELLKHRDDERRKMEALRCEITRLSSSLGELVHCPETSLFLLQQKLDEIRGDIARIEESIKGLSRAFPYADEPVSNFIVYGGEAARDFLVESIELLVAHRRPNQRALERVPAVPVGLAGKPSSLAERTFAVLLQSQTKAGDGVTPSGIILPEERAPSVVLDTEEGGVMLRVPEIKLSLGNTSERPVLRLSWDDRTEGCVLRLFQDQPGYVRTASAEYLIPIPCRECEVSLICGQDTVRRWSIDVSCVTSRPSVFHYRTGALLKDPTGAEVIWVLLPPEWNLISGVRIIESQELAGGWSSYRALLLDLTAARNEEILFERPDGERVSIQVKADLKGMPELVGRPAGFTLENELVYLGGLPALRIPLGALELEQWNLNVWRSRTTDETPDHLFSGRLSSLKETGFVTEESGLVTVTLDKLVNEVGASQSYDIAFYVIRVGGPRKFKQVYRFFQVSDADVWFEPTLLPLDSGTDQDLGEFSEDTGRARGRKVELIFPERFRFRCIPEESVLTSEPGYASILLDRGASALEGWLCDDDVRLSFYQPLPQLLVRLTHGETEQPWSERVLRAWAGDLEKASKATLSVLIRHGDYLDLSLAELTIKGTGHVVRKEIGKHVLPGGRDFLSLQDRGLHAPSDVGRPVQLDFNLLQFLDSMRSCREEAVFNLTLYCRSDSGKTAKVLDRVPLLRVQTEWLVKNFSYFLTTKESGTVVVSMSWEEVGRQSRKLLRLWRKWRPWEHPATFHIDGEKTSIELELGASTGLVPGPYAGMFEPIDPWSARSEPTFPRATGSNVFDIDLLPGELRPIIRGESHPAGPDRSRRAGIHVKEFDGVRVSDTLRKKVTCVLAFLFHDTLSGLSLVAVNPGAKLMTLPLDSTLAQSGELMWEEPAGSTVGLSSLCELKLSRTEG
ncbi:MAG TPA: hypothetical protein GX510_09190, partial [Firmicutes bacterium]|nr:hypothetical protein [Candidatus Fermentithermobacillaceae bacterium]